jgi:Acetyltransferase (GNAT) domain
MLGPLLARRTVNAEMVTIERDVHGLLHYRKYWFPSHAQAAEISESLRPNDVVRLFAVSSRFDTLPHLVERYAMRTVCINLSAGPDAILQGMKPTSCRYRIRRAEKMLNRVVIEAGSEKTNRDFLTVYNDFSRAKDLPALSPLWIHENSAHSETFVLYLDGEALCSHLFLRDAEASVVRLLYSGSRRLKSPEHAAACGALNRYLHWHEMQRYYKQGFRNFDFGGIGNSEDSITRFKLSFGGAVLTQNFYLLSGLQWVAKLGKLVYDRFLGRRSFQPKDHPLNENAELPGRLPDFSPTQGGQVTR